MIHINTVNNMKDDDNSDTNRNVFIGEKRSKGETCKGQLLFSPHSGEAASGWRGRED